MSQAEVAIEFEGLDVPRHKVQPPLIDPKTNEPYNFNDPELPVVLDHEFRVKYWAMLKSHSNMLRYLEEHWEYFNRTRFQGKLKKPHFALLKDVDTSRMSLRGLYNTPTRLERQKDIHAPGKISVSPNLFNAPHEGWVNSTLIHEMCHEWVWEIDGPDGWDEEYKIKKGHGPRWTHAMQMAGLPPSRLDYTTNDTYSGEDDKKRAIDRQEFRQKLNETRKKRYHMQSPIRGRVVYFEFKDQHSFGILVGRALTPNGDPSDRWFYLDGDTQKLMKASMRNAFHCYAEEEKPFHNDFWRRAVNRVYDELLEKDEIYALD